MKKIFTSKLGIGICVFAFFSCYFWPQLGFLKSIVPPIAGIFLAISFFVRMDKEIKDSANDENQHQ